MASSGNLERLHSRQKAGSRDRERRTRKEGGWSLLEDFTSDLAGQSTIRDLQKGTCLTEKEETPGLTEEPGTGTEETLA